MTRYSLQFASAVSALCLLAAPVWAQKDPGVRGPISGQLEYAAMLNFLKTGQIPSTPPIPHPPLLSPNPTSGAKLPSPDQCTSFTQSAACNESLSFFEGILRAGQLESSCDECAMVTDGSPANVRGELDPIFPQFTTNSNGLGARHNADQCFVCHAQPTLGGSGGFLVPNPQQVAQGQKPLQPENPLFRLVPTRFGKQNITPAFEQQFGPIREVRFIHKVDSNGNVIFDSTGQPVPDGGVHQLWIVKGIQGDTTITGCAITQPDFATQFTNGNLSFRIPLQMTGLGLIDSIQDREILGHHDSTAAQRTALGISGHPNRSGNDGTITRFGWKAQNKSITMFAAEAYNVEMGITNELFPTATEEDPNCNGSQKPEPNDATRTDTSEEINQAFANPLHILADWMQFQLMMRFTDAPQPVSPLSASAANGQNLFNQIGCNLCHTSQMQTAPVMLSAVLQNRPANLFSDLLVHHMGVALADGVTQGAAGPDEFRTTPLWGLGPRIFFLHDGRTTDLLQAILAHQDGAPNPNPMINCGTITCFPSEANAVISNFKALKNTDQQSVLDFLRSL
jgi:Di-haem oxidoreductase, putative peroxidase